MIRETLEAIDGIWIAPVFVLVLFTVTFALIALWAWRYDKHEAIRMSFMPLDSEIDEISRGEVSDE